MLTFLTILKICGIVVACILGLVLLFVFLVLFVPFRYDADVSFKGNKVKAFANVKWDLKAIKVWYIQNEDGTHDGEALLFGIRLMRFNTDSDWLDIQIAKAKKWFSDNYHGIMRAPEGPIACLGNIKEELKKPKWSTAVKKGFYRIKTVILEIFPKTGNGEVVIGLDDPYLTGKALEILAVLYPLYGKVFQVCPDFNQKIFTCDLNIKGKARIRIIAYHVLVLILHKQARMLYHELMRLTHYE